jgi:hypothetical protein
MDEAVRKRHLDALAEELRLRLLERRRGEAAAGRPDGRPIADAIRDLVSDEAAVLEPSTRERLIARLRLIQAPPARPVKPPARWPVRALASEELAGLAATVEAVSDAGLRSALARLGRTVKAQLADPDRRRPAAG